jgi:hypothetical protein
MDNVTDVVASLRRQAARKWRTIMTTYRIARVLAAIGLFAASVSFAETGSYRVSAILSYNGHAFASPVILVQAGVPAAVEVSGPEAYRFTVTVTAAGNGTVKVSTKLRCSYGTISPAMLVQLGQLASVSEGEIGMSLTTEARGS